MSVSGIRTQHYPEKIFCENLLSPKCDKGGCLFYGPDRAKLFFGQTFNLENFHALLFPDNVAHVTPDTNFVKTQET